MNRSDTSRFWLGVACTLIGGAFWGISGSGSEFLLEHYSIDPMFIVVFREAAAALLFLVVLVVRYRKSCTQLLCIPQERMRLALFGLALFTCQITYVVAIGLSNAGTVTVLQSANCIIVMVATCLSTRVLPHGAEVLGLIAAVVATWLIATGGDPSQLVLPLPALLWGLSTAVSAAVYTMYPRRLFDRWGSFCVTASGMVIGALVSCVVASMLALAGRPVAVPDMDATGWIVLGVIAVLGTFAAFTLFLHGVSVVGSVKGSLLGCIEPISATIVSAVWLKTVFSETDVAGLILMIVAVALVTVRKRQSLHS